jgi:hypothetical protein
VISMPADTLATRLLASEARALLTRLAQLRPFALNMPMVSAAEVSPAAQSSIDLHMLRARRRLKAMVRDYLRWLLTPEGRGASPVDTQRRFTILRLRFNNLISEFEIFKDVLSQRSEHETGVWVAGLDDLAADALRLTGDFYDPPPVICYVDRGHGAAIRRARTRLPGGEPSPVAVIKVPRERLVGSGIASSLVHEVGHQGAALLDLVNSLTPILARMEAESSGPDRIAWHLWQRWLSECVADFWSVAKVGVASTLGLLGVLSLPRAFVFRIDMEDPHPAPWIRMKMSCAFGSALYPHPQWFSLDSIWQSFYGLEEVSPARKVILSSLVSTLPRFVSLVADHRPPSLEGKRLRDVMGTGIRQPSQLMQLFDSWRNDVEAMRRISPTLVFAAMGQARMEGRITPETESRLLGQVLTGWATDSAMNTSRICAGRQTNTIRMPARRLNHTIAV